MEEGKSSHNSRRRSGPMEERKSSHSSRRRPGASVGNTSGSSRTAADKRRRVAAPAATAPMDLHTMSQSVVTVVGMTACEEQALFGSGFILLSQPQYTIVFASALLCNTRSSSNVRATAEESYCKGFCVYFNDHSRVRKDAHVVAQCPKSRFMILLIEDDVNRRAVTPCPEEDPARQEVIWTIAAMGGTRLHPMTPAISELIGVVGYNKGVVITPSCRASLVTGKDDKGTNDYMIFKCNFQDSLVDLQTIDYKYRRSNTLVAAPVFRKKGEMLGVVHCAGTWPDHKNGLLAGPLQKQIYLLLGMPRIRKLRNWLDVLDDVRNYAEVFVENNKLFEIMERMQ